MTELPEQKQSTDSADSSHAIQPAAEGLSEVVDTATRLGREALAGGAVNRAEESLNIETRWGYMIEAASAVLAEPVADRPSIPSQPTTTGRRKSRQLRQAKPLSPLRTELVWWVSQFAMEFEAPEYPENESLIGIENVQHLMENPRLATEILWATDWVLGQFARKETTSPDNIARELRIRQGCMAIRAGMEANVPSTVAEDEATIEFDRVTKLIESQVTRYHELEVRLRTPGTIDNATRVADRQTQRGCARVLARELQKLSPGMSLAFEEHMLRKVIQLEDDAARRGKGTHAGIYESYVSMVKGIRLEIASINALQYEFSRGAHKGRWAEETSIKRDTLEGVDVDVFEPEEELAADLPGGVPPELLVPRPASAPPIPGGDEILGVVVGIDIKARGVFGQRVRDGKYRPLNIPGYERYDGMFALKDGVDEPVLVVNAEHPITGGLMSGRAIRIRRGGQMQVFETEALTFKHPPQFVRAIKLATKTLTLQTIRDKAASE